MKTIFAIVTVLFAVLAQARETPIYNGKLTSPLNANQQTITNLPNPTVSSGVATKGYVDSVGGLTPAVATNIASSIVAHATNAVYIAATNDAAAKFLPFAGGAMTGEINTYSVKEWSELSTSEKGFISLGDISDYTGESLGHRSKILSFNGSYGGAANGVVAWGEVEDSSSKGAKVVFAKSDYGTLSNQSEFTPDGSPVLTENSAALAGKASVTSNNPVIKGTIGKQFNYTTTTSKMVWGSEYAQYADYAGSALAATSATSANRLSVSGMSQTIKNLNNEGYHIYEGGTDMGAVASSNMVVAVVDDRADRAITSAVDAAMTDILGSDWKTTYGGGLAGIIAAIAAALTWLKTKKQDKLTEGAGIYIASNYAWSSSDYGTLYSTSVPSVGSSVTAYSDAACTTASSYVNTIACTATDTYVPMKGGEAAQGTITLTGNNVISTDAVRSFSAVGGQTPTVSGGVADLQSLFSSENTSLNAAIDAEIASRCASLDPAKSSIADIINALQGN